MTSTGAGIVGWGAISPLGLSAMQTGLFLRATRKGAGPTPFVDVLGERIIGSFVRVLPPTLTGPRRLARLAWAAFDHVLRAMRGAPGGLRTGILMAVPERYADGPRADGRLGPEGNAFVEHFRRGLPAQWSEIHLETYPLGHAGGAAALERAARWLSDGNADVAIVGGVDSYYEWPVLERLAAQHRLLSPDNLDGLLPGEGAAFVVLTREGAVPGARAVARVTGIGTGTEPVPFNSDEPCLAHGLTAALDGAMAPLRAAGQRSNFWLIDLTHEAYRVKEFQIVIARFGDVLGTTTTLLAPARDYGDTGAATLPLFWVLALEAWHRGYAADRTAVTIAGSDRGTRGAVLLEAT